jgi:hypothetical protein
MSAIPFVIVPQFLDVLFHFKKFFFFPLCFSFGKVSIDLSSSPLVLFSDVQSTNEPIKSILHFCHSDFAFQHFLYGFFFLFFFWWHWGLNAC